MCEHLLSPDVLAKASLRGLEYGWRPADVEVAVEDARARGLAVVGGQAQFRMPDATCEPYWLDVDPCDRRSDEPWAEWVQRSAGEVVAKFRRLKAETDCAAEVDDWPALRDRAAAGEDVMDHVYIILYFQAGPQPADTC